MTHRILVKFINDVRAGVSVVTPGHVEVHLIPEDHATTVKFVGVKFSRRWGIMHIVEDREFSESRSIEQDLEKVADRIVNAVRLL